MKQLIFVVVALSSLQASAQFATRELVETERSFAAKSVASGTRDAFLAFMDSSSVLFAKDSFIHGMAFWKARERRPGILNWKPVVAELSASGDWGFTTGPWTFTNRAGDTASGRGHFFTIWHKDSSGRWKFLFDCGAEGGREPLNELYSFQAPKRPGTAFALMQAERDFSARMQTDVAAAHQVYLSITSVLIRNTLPAAITPGQQSKWLRSLPGSVSGKHIGLLLAPAKDLGLVYGTITSDGKVQPYLRLWRNEPGGWRLAVELLNF